jgi:hypothetical protein
VTDKTITTAAEMRVAAAKAVGDLRRRDIPRSDAEDAGEGYDLAIDEAQEAIRALPVAAPDPLDDPRVQALVELLKAARLDLALYVARDWPEPQRSQYLHIEKKYRHDMGLCYQIDAALAAFEKDRANG